MSQPKPDPARSRHRRAPAHSVTPPENAPKPPDNLPARPAPDDRKGWKTYWKEGGQRWRTEPEIDVQRQQELSMCLAIDGDIEQDLYPFQGVKLSRADVEWLLATHENGRGPVDWNDERQRKRWGLDLRGAD